MLAGLSVHAQNQKVLPAEKHPDTGAIEGRVFCDDSKSPARFATVLTIPIPTFDANGKGTLPKVSRTNVAKTNLDGDYTLTKISSGDYFVLAEMQGYLSPVAQFRKHDLDNLKPETIKKLIELLPSVHVEPGRTARADVTLERGASISGTVTYDDGSPAIGAYIQIEPAQNVPNSGRPMTQGMIDRPIGWTDDHGQYRINGLPDGKYIVAARMSHDSSEGNPMATQNSESDAYREYPEFGEMTIYAEQALHKENAEILEVTQGKELSDVDIVIPLHAFHSISGSVVAQGNQPSIVFGFVSLQDANDKTFTRNSVILADSSFQFPYLAPGKYELKTFHLSDQPPSVPNQPEQGTAYTYKDATVTVEIMNKDLSDVILAVTETARPASPGAQKP